MDGSDAGVDDLVPTGTVTLLLAAVEGSPRLWATQHDEMTAVAPALDRKLGEAVAAHDGVRLVEQGNGDGFVVAFTRTSDAVACALDLQRSQFAPIRLRIGLYTGEIQPSDHTGLEDDHIGRSIKRAQRLRNLAHGGQTVLSGITADLVADRLPDDVWLSDLGSHHLPGMARAERVVQLCHPGIQNVFPPLVMAKKPAGQGLPRQLTSFVGRATQIVELRDLLADNRLVTLTGAGGAGKTRLALQLAAQLQSRFRDRVWYVDLAPINDPEVLSAAAARAMGLPDQPGRSTMETLASFIGHLEVLMVLDNCEHLLDASATLVLGLLGACPALTLLATSREPIGVPSEVIWLVPSLSLADEAIELFAERARQSRPNFGITDGDVATIAEICRRLDGMPLAIELAAARVRALSLTEIVDGLHDRFRLLTGGARTAVRRQQTLRASVDWSHALLTEPERALFRRLAVFMGGFDFDAVHQVGSGEGVQRHQVLDQLALLVDKSLVVAENSTDRSRYRMLETVRQYAQEKLAESVEADAVRCRHREYYTTLAFQLHTPTHDGHDQRIDRYEVEIDNLRAAFAWSREQEGAGVALRLASSLQPLWLTRGRLREGVKWFDAVLAEADAVGDEVAPSVLARALADKAVLGAWLNTEDNLADAQRAVTIARDLDDSPLLARALTACGSCVSYDPVAAQPYLVDAINRARAASETWTLSQALHWQAFAANTAGNPILACAAGEEGRDLADAIGDGFHSRSSRWCLGLAQIMNGDLTGAVALLGEVAAEADAAHDLLVKAVSLYSQGQALAYLGDTRAARVTLATALETAAELGNGILEGFVYAVLAVAALAEGDVRAAGEASEAARQRLSAQPVLATVNINPTVDVALAQGELIAARRLADDVVSVTTGWHLGAALITRARVAIAEGKLDCADRDAHDALACIAGVGAYERLPEILECLAELVGQVGRYAEAARLFGAASEVRQRTGAARFTIYDAGYLAAVAAARDAMGQEQFDEAWAEGTALTVDEAIAYAQRGRGERKRPTSGWASLTPTERDVVRLVIDGLANKTIATRLFISPRTVESHLTHVYTKLGLRSRVQLVKEAARQG